VLFPAVPTAEMVPVSEVGAGVDVDRVGAASPLTLATLMLELPAEAAA